MERKKLYRRWWFAMLLALAGAASLSAGGYYVWLRTPPPLPSTAEQALAVLQSERFKRLPESRKQAYYDRAAELWKNLGEDGKRRMRDAMKDNGPAQEAVGNMMANVMLDRARKFVTSTPAERKVQLDVVIGLQELAQKDWLNRTAKQAAKPPTPEEEGKRRQHREEGMRRVQKMVEEGNPQRQAYMGEFLKALRKRREERGLDPDAGFAPRGR